MLSSIRTSPSCLENPLSDLPLNTAIQVIDYIFTIRILGAYWKKTTASIVFSSLCGLLFQIENLLQDTLFREKLTFKAFNM